MAETQTSLKVDFTGGMFILGVFLLIIMFWGKPDLHDAIIYRLMGPQASQAEMNPSQ